MNNTRKPSLSIAIWIILGGIYIFSLWWFRSSKGNIIQLVLDLFLFVFALSAWKFFFSQFLLPVLTLENRKKIYYRLLAGSQGPALFIKNGQIIGEEGERDKAGKGVIVLDTASAVVLKKFSGFTRTAGPGVVFTEKGESIAESIDLHRQSASWGPKNNENPFLDKKNTNNYEEIQKRRFQTSALTRDGIEVVPTISVSFKIDADPAKGNAPGSRFGYDEKAVKKAVWHTAINPQRHTSRQEVRWNQTPIYLAVDLWREYLSKYKFDELFQATQEIPSNIEKVERVKSPPSQPIIPSVSLKKETGFKHIIFDLYQSLNRFTDKLLAICNQSLALTPAEGEKTQERNKENTSFSATKTGEKETALEAIIRMINQRLKESHYDAVNYYGKPEKKKEKSREYAFLKEERGIRVLGVNIHSLRFNDQVEQNFKKSWTANWLKFAEKEKELIAKQKEYTVLKGKEKALLDYAYALSKEFVQYKEKNIPGILNILLRGTHKEIIRNNQRLSEAKTEIEEISDLVHWVGRGDKNV